MNVPDLLRLAFSTVRLRERAPELFLQKIFGRCSDETGRVVCEVVPARKFRLEIT